ncbi:hypothetical protein MPER_13013 [Moniliophthora perniciosa FA553]|nr:hypothetical protein MPER_13013 [Moniliophthora perniciosa FA553]
MPYQDISDDEFRSMLERQEIPPDMEKELAEFTANFGIPPNAFSNPTPKSVTNPVTVVNSVHAASETSVLTTVSHPISAPEIPIVNNGPQIGSSTNPTTAATTTAASSASPSPLAHSNSNVSNGLPQASPEPPAVVGDGNQNNGVLTPAAKRKMALKRKNDAEKQATEAATEEKGRKPSKRPRKGKGNGQRTVVVSANTKPKPVRAKASPPLRAKSTRNSALPTHLADGGYEAPTKGRRG